MAKKKSIKRKSAKKKKSSRTKNPSGKKSASRKAVKKKPAAKKSSANKSSTKKKSATKKPAGKKSAGKSSRRGPSLGRARVPADARLDVMFQKDYQAREVFEFLQVTTVRELEEHAPDEIIERMTRPLSQTVDRIRKSLALANRCLVGDERFAAEFLDECKQSR